MKLVIASSEAIPYIKSGGLADVAGALSVQYDKAGHETSLFLPLYAEVQKHFDPVTIISAQKIFLGERGYYFDVLRHRNTYFIANDYFFRRAGLYGNESGDFPDNVERFAFFCKAIVHTIKKHLPYPDIVHIHDWQTALLPLYMSFDPTFKNTKTVFTVHNMGYQGIASHDILPKIGIPEHYFALDGLEYYGNVNLLKAGILFSNAVTTVSPTYAREITTPAFGFGLDGVLRDKGVTGILNGLDYNLWDPSKDSSLKAPFSKTDSGKKSICKKALVKIGGFREKDRPLIGIIGRFAVQKGFDLIMDEIESILHLRANIVILGKGDTSIETSLMKIAARFPDQIYVRTSFDDSFARRIYAGSDLFLMPSRYEPCGVAQMIAMRYGAIPVVTMTGGLTDTVSDFNTGDLHGTGFVFRQPDPDAMLECIKRALFVYSDKSVWKRLTTNAMNKRFRWSDSVKKYNILFDHLLGKSSHAH